MTSVVTKESENQNDKVSGNFWRQLYTFQQNSLKWLGRSQKLVATAKRDDAGAMLNFSVSFQIKKSGTLPELRVILETLAAVSVFHSIISWQVKHQNYKLPVSIFQAALQG